MLVFLFLLVIFDFEGVFLPIHNGLSNNFNVIIIVITDCFHTIFIPICRLLRRNC